MKNVRIALCCLALTTLLSVPNADARPRRPSPRGETLTISQRCPQVDEINERRQFWKNNKPLRAGPQIDAPVIGYFRQMTLAHNAGVNDYNLAAATTLYDRKGNVLSAMIPYACRSDHCGGRVVSTVQTGTARIAAIRRTNKPVGYVKVSKRRCIKIPDIGRCYGVEVDLGRPLCNQTVDR